MKMTFLDVFGQFRCQDCLGSRSIPDEDPVLTPEVLHVQFGKIWRGFRQVLGTLTTNDKCQQEQEEEEEEEQQQLLSLYDLGFAAGKKKEKKPVNTKKQDSRPQRT